MYPSQALVCLLLLLTFSFVASQPLAADFTGRVVGVSDGDTLTDLRQRHLDATTLERPLSKAIRRPT